MVHLNPVLGPKKYDLRKSPRLGASRIYFNISTISGTVPKLFFYLYEHSGDVGVADDAVEFGDVPLQQQVQLPDLSIRLTG